MYDFKRVEFESEKVWKRHEKKIKKAVLYDKKKPLFSFLEGPPTANAPPGLHHFEVRTFKDIICKFKFMQVLVLFQVQKGEDLAVLLHFQNL